MSAPTDTQVHSEVQDYYGKVLGGTEDLKTNACCTGAAPPEYIKQVLSQIHDEVASHYYGCGLVAPPVLEGMRVLDLGSGSGRDCFLLSKLVGPKGYVVGVDMTPEQVKIAKKHVDYHMKKFGFEKPNVEFKLGFIENLEELGLEENSFDIIISNCVVNLSPDKPAVLREAFRVLKHGGEMYFSDVYSDRRVPVALTKDKLLWGECLSGALYWNDFGRLARAAGFTDPRLVEDAPITVQNKAVQALLGPIRFFSATYRLFKMTQKGAQLETDCEDYGQAVIYKGGIQGFEHTFVLDKHHSILKGKVFPVCGNTHLMLHESRFKPYFEFIGDMSTHFGKFEACGGSVLPFDSAPASAGSGSACGTGGSKKASCC